MVGDFLLAFVLSVLVYGSVAALIVIWIERLYQRRLRWWDVRLKTLNSAIDVINFANAVVASILSSLELYRLEDRFRVRGSRTDTPLADYTLRSVCGYIAAEIGFVSLVGCNYVRRGNVGAWTLLKQIYAEMLLFHAVAFVGLTSVVLRNTGYPFALWVVWSELTSVFIGLQTFTADQHSKSVESRPPPPSLHPPSGWLWGLLTHTSLSTHYCRGWGLVCRHFSCFLIVEAMHVICTLYG